MAARASAESAASFVPLSRNLATLAAAAQACRGCDLYQRATQTVFGAGKRGARLLLVGEQPGDQEDRQGQPFVGPAGRLLAEACEAAGIQRDDVYLTNAVKHFKWTPRGKRRLHAKPSARQVTACRPWLEAELDSVAPEVIVCLGATAAQSLLGSSFRVTRQRGEFVPTRWDVPALATYHPAAILRAPDEDRARLRREFVADLRRAASHRSADGRG